MRTQTNDSTKHPATKQTTFVSHLMSQGPTVCQPHPTTTPTTFHTHHQPKPGMGSTSRARWHQSKASSTIPLVNTTRCRLNINPRRPEANPRRAGHVLLRKEVIQPHLPVRLPCYDFVPIANPTFDGSLPQGVGPPASGVTDFHDVTGGVYKARERIHRSVADLRLLATPTSWGRVADPNPN